MTVDAETVTVEAETEGPPVDRPVTPAPGLAGWRGVARALLALCVRLLVWSPRGAWRLSVKLSRWIADASGRPAPLAEGVDPDAYRRAAELHDTHVRHRLIGLAVVVVLVAVAGSMAWIWAPRWAFVIVVVGLVLALARVGRPEGGRLVDPIRVRQGSRYTRLTGELVRGALVALRLPGLKSPDDVTFTQEIGRDGPGQLARVALPPGVEAVTVVAARGRLSSALRLPLDQVWPAVGPNHEGELDLWVGYQPTSKMKAPRWELTSATARTSVFEPFTIGTDQRQRPVTTAMFARNFLIGGVPGSGKSYAARVLALGAALDPTCELRIAELKGTADFGDLADLAAAYVCGVDDASLTEAGELFRWGLAEAARRADRIRRFREAGLAPEGKVTPELARRPGSGLHPVVIVVDEAHELLTDKAVAEAAERLIKRGRALGIVVVLATQIPDRDSVPPAITRCVNVRWCLAVQDQVANDMILGTGAYKRGVSTLHYVPERDAGWGVVVGLGQPHHVRSAFPTEAETAAIVRRARELRGDQVVTGEAEAPDRDPIADAITVMEAAGADRAHWVTLAELLAARWPDRYGAEDRASVAALLRGLGVADEPVSVAGRKARGCRLASLQAAQQRGS